MRPASKWFYAGLILFILLLCGVLYFSFGETPVLENAATRQARQERNRQLGTQMADVAQSTAQGETRGQTATAVTNLELVQQATIDAQVSATAKMAQATAYSLEATALASQSTATAIAREMYLAAIQEAEPTLEFTFDRQDPGWPLGEQSGDLATVEWRIEDGRYIWQASATQPFAWWVLPDMDDIGDFYLTAEIEQLEGPPEVQFGLIFRQAGPYSFYLFELNGLGQFLVGAYNQGSFQSMFPWIGISEIKTGSPNHLAVLAQGSDFQFFINDQFVAAVGDEQWESGKIGIIVGISTPGESATWTFDNIRVYDLPELDSVHTPTP